MSEKKSSRREMLERTVVLTVAAGLPLGLLACGGGELRCNDESSLSTADRDARRASGYTERASDATRACTGCNFYTATPNACGSCVVVRGPIHPAGSCNLFVARA